MNAKRATNIAILAYFCAECALVNTMYEQYKNIASADNTNGWRGPGPQFIMGIELRVFPPKYCDVLPNHFLNT